MVLFLFVRTLGRKIHICHLVKTRHHEDAQQKLSKQGFFFTFIRERASSQSQLTLYLSRGLVVWFRRVKFHLM